MEMKLKKRPRKQCFNIIRSLDIYGYPINLTYQNDTTFKSFLGGVSTIIYRIFNIFACKYSNPY